MQSGRYHYTQVFLPCHHCAALISWPRWAREEQNRYIPLCWPCYAALDVTFTAANVLLQAAAIIRESAVTR